MTDSHSSVRVELLGLPDRHVVRDAIDAAREQLVARGRPSAVLLVEVAGLPCSGDGAATEIATRLAAVLGPDDLVGRFGGDVLVVVARDIADEAAGHALAAHVKHELDAPFGALGGGHVRASVGVTLLREQDPSVATVVARADDARPVAGSRRALVEAAFECSTIEDFDVYYQPIADLRSGSVAAIEAVVHWEHPDLGTIAPGEIVPIAERRGQIVSLGRWVLEKACAQTVRWAPTRDGHPMRTCVNVAAAQVADPAFTDDILAALARSGATGHQLALGLTQDALAAIPPHVAELLASARIELMLRNVGVGAGPSPAQLRGHRISMIKLDGSLVTRCPLDAVPAMLERTTELARGLDARAVAAGIETLDQLTMVREAGFALAQGYLFRRPLSAAAIEQLVYGERPFASLLAPRPAWLDLPLDGDAPTIEIGAPAVP